MEEERTDVVETHPSGTTREVREVRDPDLREREVREVRDPEPRVSTHVRSTTVAPRQEVDHLESVAYDPYEGRRLAAYRLTQMIYWIFGLIEALILIRLVLKVLGANQTAGFAQFIYGITA